ncbi:hypothetical protein DFH08DRAFT_812460 [Mycena albidolilacea]|uniref:Uncharacterized protein n=1 Tax=Mycena albidolilacea TaxID=1033008 RepID=A0AAD7ELW5_9AGAR|nr:hypothetical protein DFH08DRAFT_812460 [Mycena albidolilacea]
MRFKLEPCCCCRRSGLLSDPKREIANVHKCMDVIRLCESRWQLAGMLGDVLGELASFCQLPASHTRAGEPNADNQPPADAIFDILPSSRSWRQPDIQPPQHEAPFPPFPSSLFANGDHTDPEIPDFVPMPTSSPIINRQRTPYLTFCLPDIQPPQNEAPFPPFPSSLFASGDHTDPEIADFVPPNPMPTSSTSAIQPEDDTYTDPAQASRELAAMMNHLDRDVMAVWTNAPTGLGASDWGAYFSYFSETLSALGETVRNGASDACRGITVLTAVAFMKIAGGAAVIEDTEERGELDDMVKRVYASELDDPAGDWGAVFCCRHLDVSSFVKRGLEKRREKREAYQQNAGTWKRDKPSMGFRRGEPW